MKMIAIEKPTVKGTHIFSFCDVRSEKAKKLQAKLQDISARNKFVMESIWEPKARLKMLNDLHAEYSFYIKNLHRFFKTREQVIENITVTVGRTDLARRLRGDTTYTNIVNYTAVGSDATAANVADATLGGETSRKALSSGTNSNNVAYLETFFAASEAVATHQEYGMFIDGSAGANTGQLFNRFTGVNAKSNIETMNVQSIITFNDA